MCLNYLQMTSWFTDWVLPEPWQYHVDVRSRNLRLDILCVLNTRFPYNFCNVYRSSVHYNFTIRKPERHDFVRHCTFCFNPYQSYGVMLKWFSSSLTVIWRQSLLYHQVHASEFSCMSIAPSSVAQLDSCWVSYGKFCPYSHTTISAFLVFEAGDLPIVMEW
jgi:hypothetical protein